MKKLPSIDALLAYCEDVALTQPAFEAARTMCSVYAGNPRANEMAGLDPFSSQYLERCQPLYSEPAGVGDYDPWLPVLQKVTLGLGGGTCSHVLAPGERAMLRVSGKGPFIRSSSQAIRPIDVSRGSIDIRPLGVAVESVTLLD